MNILHDKGNMSMYNTDTAFNASYIDRLLGGNNDPVAWDPDEYHRRKPPGIGFVIAMVAASNVKKRVFCPTK